MVQKIVIFIIKNNTLHFEVIFVFTPQQLHEKNYIQTFIAITITAQNVIILDQ